MEEQRHAVVAVLKQIVEQRREAVFCRHCGTPLPGVGKFCPGCGAGIDTASAPPPRPDRPQGQQPQPEPPQTAEENTPWHHLQKSLGRVSGVIAVVTAVPRILTVLRMDMSEAFRPIAGLLLQIGMVWCACFAVLTLITSAVFAGKKERKYRRPQGELSGMVPALMGLAILFAIWWFWYL